MSKFYDLALLATVAIGGLDEALTFARIGDGDARRVLAVRRWEGGTVEAVDLSKALGRAVADPISIFSELGHEALRERISSAPESARVAVPATELVAPVDLGGHHVAVGTNYPSHANEAHVVEGPFLFPKIVAPSGPRASVSAGKGLLDHEVELAFVLLGDLEPGKPTPPVGLVLANDFTDRETLLRHVDPWNPTSGKGFTTGKSVPGYLPVGALFVVPRDFRAFAAGLEMRLWVNDELRQEARIAEALWDFDRILAETRARRGVTWEHRGGRVALTDENGRLPARTLIVSGTPSGTIFRGVSLGTKLGGVARWIGNGFSRSLPSHVVDGYVADAHASGTYLKPGDRVAIHADRLGVLENTIVP